MKKTGKVRYIRKNGNVFLALCFVSSCNLKMTKWAVILGS
jgi:hypothetical protein